MENKETTIAILSEMGFSREQVEKALETTGNASVESAMEWLLTNSKDTAKEPTEVTESSVVSNTSEAEASSSSESKEVGNADSTTGAAKSIVCDDCGKKFKLPLEVEYHAAKSGHKSFSESTEEVVPLTEEEKNEQRRKLEEKIKLRRSEKEEKERQENIEREKARRKTGQDMSSSKQKMEEEQMKRIAEEKRREKLEEKMARQRVKDQIEKDKIARKEKFAMNNPVNTSVEMPKPAQPVPKKDYDQCRLQIRLSDGKILTQNFGAQEPLAAVRLYIEMNRSDGCNAFQLMTNFPKKVFTDEDQDKPLSALGLLPSAVLILKKM